MTGFLEDLHVDPARGGRAWFYDTRAAPMMRHSHRHAELEVNIVLRGWVDYLIGGQRIRFPGQSLGWLLPHQTHRLIHRAADVRMWIAVFTPALVADLDASDAGPPATWPDPADENLADDIPRSRMVGRTAADLAALCRRLAGPATTEAARHRIGLSWLLCECWHSYSAAHRAAAGTPLHPAVQTAVRWLHDHADEPEADDLQALARRCGISRPWLSKLFHDQLGESLTDYRNRQRSDRFRELIARSERSMTDAALAAGFGSYAQCFRVIRAQTGLTPSQLARTVDGT